ncbi:UNVERIFIED: hypothetical protein OPA17_100 [Vibrio phage OPA17]|nr:hypothetical protein [Vibrio phage vB_VpS_C2]
MLVTITGQNPNHKHCFSTLCNGSRFDVNTVSKSVTMATFNPKTGSRFVPVKSGKVRDAVLNAVLKHVTENKDQ